MKTKKFGDVDPASGRKWGGSPITHSRHLKRGLERGVIDLPCGDCRACCLSGVPVYEDDGTELGKRRDGGSIHLDAGDKCDRYETRPEHCRLYTCTLFSIASVVTDSPVMNAALALWEWDLSRPADAAFAERARAREARISQAEMEAEEESP